MENGEKRKRQHRQDRITLTPESTTRLDVWLGHLTENKRGIQVTRNDLVDWAIQSRNQTLAAEEVNQLTFQFFNEVKFLEQTLKELRQAKARGESIELASLLDQMSKDKTRRPPLMRKKKQAAVKALARTEMDHDATELDV